MKIKVFLFIIFTVTAVSFAIGLNLLLNTTPSSREVLVLFYLALLAFLAGLFFLISYAAGYWKSQVILSWYQTISCLRLSIIISTIVVALLSLHAAQLLNWAWFLVLIVVAVITELTLRRRTFQNKFQ